MKVVSFSVWSSRHGPRQPFEVCLRDLEELHAEEHCSDARAAFLAGSRKDASVIAAIIEEAFGEPVPCIGKIANFVVEVREHAAVARKLKREVGLWDELERMVDYAPVFALVEGYTRIESTWQRKSRGHPKTDSWATEQIVARAREHMHRARTSGETLSARGAASLATDELAAELELRGIEKTRAMNRARKALANKARRT
jgi:hypothetical protein